MNERINEKMKALTLLITFVLLIATQFIGCIKAKGPTAQGSKSSKITSVKMQVPSKIGSIDISGKITGYTLRVEKTSGNCTFSDINRTEKIDIGDIKIDAQLRQECDYAITLSFGIISQDGQRLEKVYLTSDQFDGKPSRPTLVNQDDLKGKSEIAIKACVSVTSLGSQDLGVKAVDCPGVNSNPIGDISDSTDVISQTLKLSKTLTGTPEGFEVYFDGEVISVAPDTKYCALGIEAHYGAATPKLIIYDEGFFEIRAGEKLSLNKTLSVDVESSDGPLSFSELRVLEKCVNERPQAQTKASNLLAECFADKQCGIVQE
jgi:hypothetical protein